MVTPGKPVTSIMVPGHKGVGHAWAYLPDVGETFARLLDRDADLPRFARYHFAGHWDADGLGLAEAIQRVTGRPAKLRRMPWRLLPLIAPFNPTMREMIEMEAYWRHPLALDNASLVAVLGEEPHTPLDEAMEWTLTALGCLD
jgi:nucleoside-diphosphate-sugar epimerase